MPAARKTLGMRQAEARLIREACLKLPALTSIDPLLLRTDPVQEERQVEEPKEQLPPVAVQSRGPSRATFLAVHATRRLYGRDPGSSDSFRACLELPPLSLGRGSSCGSTSPAGAPGEDHARPGDEGGGEQARGWHVVLLQETFVGDEALSLAAAASALARALGIEADEAEALAQGADEGAQVVLEACDVQAEALHKAELLRDMGLVVRVTARPTKDASPCGVGGRVQGFAKQCNGTLRGDLLRLGRRLSQKPATGPLPPRCGAGWRQDAELRLKLVPEDPIEALFNAERDRAYRQELARATAAAAQAEGKPKKPSLQSIVRTSILTRNLGEGEILRSLLAEAPATPKDRATAAAQAMPEAAGQGAAPGQPSAITASERWDTVLAAGLPKKRISPVWKEACRLMRTFVYGNIGTGDATSPRHEEDIYQEAIGSKEMVQTLYGLWVNLDSDHSGRVDLREFRTFAKDHLKDRFESGMRVAGQSTDDLDNFVYRLCEKVERLLLEKKTSFAIEDVMRLLWPAAGAAQLRAMKQWTREMAMIAERSKIKPPPVLPREEFDGLRSIFRLFDKKCRGTVQFSELVELGVIHEYQLEQYRSEWDHDSNGHVDMLEFCEMMCPAGYRAHAHAKVGSLPDGRRVLFDPNLKSWRLEDGADELDRGWI